MAISAQTSKRGITQVVGVGTLPVAMASWQRVCLCLFALQSTSASPLANRQAVAPRDRHHNNSLFGLNRECWGIAPLGVCMRVCVTESHRGWERKKRERSRVCK